MISKAVDVLMVALKEGNTEERKYVLDAISKMGATAVETLIASLSSEDS